MSMDGANLCVPPGAWNGGTNAASVKIYIDGAQRDATDNVSLAFSGADTIGAQTLPELGGDAETANMFSDTRIRLTLSSANITSRCSPDASLDACEAEFVGRCQEVLTSLTVSPAASMTKRLIFLEPQLWRG
jgi:hypothetical protein